VSARSSGCDPWRSDADAGQATGGAIRVPGRITPEKLAILRKADATYLEEIERAGPDDAIRQAFAVLLPMKTVGVMGHGHICDHVCAPRAVTSTVGMTADYVRVETRIINEVCGGSAAWSTTSPRSRPGRSSGSDFSPSQVSHSILQTYVTI
jgi:hypothetical protein